MDKDEQIRQGLRHFSGRYGPVPTMLGTVTAVDEETKTCVLNVDDLDIPDIRLNPVTDDGESITMFPKIGSYAMAVRIEQTDEWMLIASKEIDKYRLVVKDLVFEIASGKLLIKKSDDSLKDVLRLIIEAVQQIQVIYGNNPAYEKLTEGLVKLNNIFE